MMENDQSRDQYSQKYITRSVNIGNTSMTHQMYEWAIFRFAPSANLRARISGKVS